jgi:hypothetical protein
MPIVQTNTEHPQRTRRNQLRYQFTTKHHGGPGSKGDQAQWIDSLTFAEEFSIFDDTDFFEILDAKGNLYGVMREPNGDLRDIGTRQEQLAKFQRPRSGPWHGYPCWVINKSGRSNRRKQKMFPPKQVFHLLQMAGLISEEQRDRLKRGDHA